MFYIHIICFGFVSIVNSNSLYFQQIVPKVFENKMTKSEMFDFGMKQDTDPQHDLSEDLSQSMNVVQETKSETGRNIKDFYLDNSNLDLDRFGDEPKMHDARQKVNRNSSIENNPPVSNKLIYVSTDANINKRSDDNKKNSYEGSVQPYYQSQISKSPAYDDDDDDQHRPSDIEVLNSLIGKAPNAQIQGLNRLLHHHPVISEDQVNNNKKKRYGPSFAQQTLNIVEPYQIQVKLFDVDKQNRDDNLHGAQYAFGYKVSDIHSGSNFGHHETRNDDITKGYYHVVLPDGRLQNVEYWVDKTGYHAQVKYTLINR